MNGQDQDQQTAQNDTDRIERDRLANHLDAYLGFPSEGPSIEVLFKCCRRAMIEVPLILMAALPPERSSQGVRGRVRCGACGKAVRIEMMPENGETGSEKKSGQ